MAVPPLYRHTQHRVAQRVALVGLSSLSNLFHDQDGAVFLHGQGGGAEVSVLVNLV